MLPLVCHQVLFSPWLLAALRIVPSCQVRLGLSTPSGHPQLLAALYASRLRLLHILHFQLSCN